MRIYQAGPLFSEAEINWHRAMSQKLLAKGYEPLWPGDLINQELVESWGEQAALMIMKIDLKALLSCDIVLALIDGAQVDDGTAFEIGYAHAKGLPIVGYHSDFRNGGDTKHGSVNAMIEGALTFKAGNESELMACLEKLATKFN